MRLEGLNALSPEDATAELRRCCGSSRWARLMAERRPFESPEQVADWADQIWWSLAPEDWLEAFAAHPRIGAMPSGLPRPFDRLRVDPSTVEGRGITAASEKMLTENWPSHEQAGMNAASQSVRARFLQANRDYEARFGYIFIVCATGKSADEMLAILERRLSNPDAGELKIAAEEQRKITRIRLGKLVDNTCL